MNTYLGALGAAGLAVCVLTANTHAVVNINEIRIDQPGSDLDEYFELFGTPGESLAGLWYIVIGDGAGGNDGVIEEVTDLSAFSLDANGFFFMAEDANTFGFAADLLGTLSFENSDNVTHMLVSGFTGASGDDLDVLDDGILNVTPWASIIDTIALVENLTTPPTTTEWWYGPNTLGPDGSFVPGHAYRNRDGTGAWNIGDFTAGVDDTPGFTNVPTPGALALLGIAGLAGRRRRR